MRPLDILTWHTHGGYLYYLSQVPHVFHVMMKPGRPPGYGGRGGHLPWGPNVRDLAVEAACTRQFDCVLFQDDHHFHEDQYRYLTPAQRRLPRIYLEHDPPRDSPTDSPHPVDDPGMLLVHVTPYNALMWDNGRTPVRVVEHGVIDPLVEYDGAMERGVVVINNLARRGRRLGIDVFGRARGQVPLDLAGMGSRELGGLGEIRHSELARFVARYRFLFNPIRHTSLGLAVIEAMMTGVPIVALATTELATVLRDGESGFVDTDEARLVASMRALLGDVRLARRIGAEGRRRALQRFGIGRFVRDWLDVFAEVTGTKANGRYLAPHGHDDVHA